MPGAATAGMRVCHAERGATVPFYVELVQPLVRLRVRPVPQVEHPRHYFAREPARQTASDAQQASLGCCAMPLAVAECCAVLRKKTSKE